ncbi:MAG TPA: RodZ domain-containing protein [Arenimonas sp.]|uniref:RodZ domain-containing protein n=1 Tax=Arenimonas sp. TaxID=1872635 RepID=UPI002B5A22DB|nr:RodZ domain-containing protein [Arenimonas sp.]HMB57460.1 RodZ domain-containing protein [Arenimonas sp.]
MTNESFQETLFEDPIGSRFKHAREKLRWSKEAVAQQLKLPLSIIDAIELEQWSRLGAPVYVRSYIGSYAKALGLPPSLADEVVRSQPAPALAQTVAGIRQPRLFDRGVQKLTYLVMTGAIIGSVVMFAMHFQSSTPRVADVMPLDPPASTSLSAPAPAPTSIAATPAANVASSAVPVATTPENMAQPTVMASLAPSLPASAVVGDDLVINFRGESWVDVVDAAGARVERGLLPAGSQRRYGAGKTVRITVGNAEAVDVSQSGQTISLAPFREANVARFTVSSEGKIIPPGG